VVNAQRVKHYAYFVKATGNVYVKSLVGIYRIKAMKFLTLRWAYNAAAFVKEYIRIFVDGKRVLVIGVKGKFVMKTGIIRRVKIIVVNILGYQFVFRFNSRKISLYIQWFQAVRLVVKIRNRSLFKK
jgi:hypothetical protein